MRLLIVEDNPQMRRVLKSFVADYADEIYECSDGAAALGCYAKFLPDFVLMDLQMPNLDGISASLEIKAEFPQAKILIVTNYDEPEMREAAFMSGVCGYVLKENLLPLINFLERGSDGN
jgi:CheY-like chemotaxis protein